MSITKKISINNRDLLFFGTVKGLVKERQELRTTFQSYSPEVILLGISPEELDGLKKYLQEPFEIEPDDYGVIYARKLEKFGEVGLPVPTYLEVFSILNSQKIEVYPIDMPDEQYSELFAKKIDLFKIMRYDMRKRKIWKMNFKVSTPEEFAIEWDREVNKIKEFREIEIEREKYMANKIKDMITQGKYAKIMVVLEIERMNGVISHLNGQ